MQQKQTARFKKQYPTRTELEQALKEFQARGGTITKIEDPWIEDSFTPTFVRKSS